MECRSNSNFWWFVSLVIARCVNLAGGYLFAQPFSPAYSVIVHQLRHGNSFTSVLYSFRPRHASMKRCTRWSRVSRHRIVFVRHYFCFFPKRNAIWKLERCLRSESVVICNRTVNLCMLNFLTRADANFLADSWNFFAFRRISIEPSRTVSFLIDVNV